MSKDRPPHLDRLSAPVPHLHYPSLNATPEEGDKTHLERRSARSDLTRESLTAYLERRSPALGRSSVNRAQQELATRAEYPVHCSLSLQLRASDSGSGIYYKYDGQRFKHSDATVKITSGMTFEVQLSTNPVIDVAPNVLHLRSVNEDGSSHQSLIFLEKGSLDGSILKGNWKCELVPNKKNKRHEVTLSARLAHFGELSVPLLVKVYPYHNKGAQQGFKLKMVVFELKSNENNNRDGYVHLKSVRYMS